MIRLPARVNGGSEDREGDFGQNQVAFKASKRWPFFCPLQNVQTFRFGVPIFVLDFYTIPESFLIDKNPEGGCMRTIIKALVPSCMGLFLMLWTSPLHAKILNTSGTWKLNLEKSDFGKGPKPQSIMVKVVHKEPAFKYSVTGTNAEGQPMNVEFDGAIDGKPYKETGTQGGTTVTYKRVDDSNIQGTATSSDGSTTETFTLTVSKDGKVVTRKGTVKGPQGEYTTLQVYEKQ
ncbi:MAG: hypothetical protein DMG05_15200 [Acidobacteria bacterium]|nr:MAG: hypothetical protein DMG05_15200 [Acidobacteriota bacterium]